MYIIATYRDKELERKDKELFDEKDARSASRLRVKQNEVGRSPSYRQWLALEEPRADQSNTEVSTAERRNSSDSAANRRNSSDSAAKNPSTRVNRD